MAIPTQAEYESRERALFHKQLTGVKADTESRAAFERALREDPALVVDRIGWILNGSYGYGSYVCALEVARNKRMNRPAWFTNTIAALEWGCDARNVAKIWHGMTPESQEKFNELVMAEIDAALSEE